MIGVPFCLDDDTKHPDRLTSGFRMKAGGGFLRGGTPMFRRKGRGLTYDPEPKRATLRTDTSGPLEGLPLPEASGRFPSPVLLASSVRVRTRTGRFASYCYEATPFVTKFTYHDGSHARSGAH